MDIQAVLSIIFVMTLCAILILNRKKLQIQKILFPLFYFVIIRTSWGINAMKKFAKKLPTFTLVFSIISIIIGFLGMGGFCCLITKSTIELFNGAAPGVQLVLPVQVKGAIAMPFFYWIISIFFVALVHEFSHGFVAVSKGLKLKSSGFAFFSLLVPIIPAAFVEPDEKQIERKKTSAQLSVFSAGPAVNILFGFLFLALTYGMIDYQFQFATPTGILITEITQNGPVEKAGLLPGDNIISIDGKEIKTLENFTTIISETEPEQNILVKTDRMSHSVFLGNKTGTALFGAKLKQNKMPTSIFSGVFDWLLGLVYWLFHLNLGIGLFNLAPIGPIDGGRMLKTTLEKYLGKKGTKISTAVTLIFLLMIIINIGAGLIR